MVPPRVRQQIIPDNRGARFGSHNVKTLEVRLSTKFAPPKIDHGSFRSTPRLQFKRAAARATAVVGGKFVSCAGPAGVAPSAA